MLFNGEPIFSNKSSFIMIVERTRGEKKITGTRGLLGRQNLKKAQFLVLAKG